MIVWYLWMIWNSGGIARVLNVTVLFHAIGKLQICNIRAVNTVSMHASVVVGALPQSHDPYGRLCCLFSSCLIWLAWWGKASSVHDMAGICVFNIDWKYGDSEYAVQLSELHAYQASQALIRIAYPYHIPYITLVVYTFDRWLKTVQSVSHLWLPANSYTPYQK